MTKDRTSMPRWRRPALMAALIATILVAIRLGRAGDEPKQADPPAAGEPEPISVQYPDLETDAAFAGTWELISGGRETIPPKVERPTETTVAPFLVTAASRSDLQKVGDRIVVEETILDHGPNKGRSVWNWHQPGDRPVMMTSWTSYVEWGPSRTAAKPWPIIEMYRGSSRRRPPVEAIYELKGDKLSLAFPTYGGKLPADFRGGDVEVWKRVAPPVAKLEPDSVLNGRWRLASIVFHAAGTFGAVAHASLPAHLIGTTEPHWFLKQGTIFEVKDGAWKEEDRSDAGLSWTTVREMKLPRRVYKRRMPEPRPPGVPAEDDGTYDVGMAGLTITFHQKWLGPNSKGEIYLYSGERIETYERLSSRPNAPKP